MKQLLTGLQKGGVDVLGYTYQVNPYVRSVKSSWNSDKAKRHRNNTRITNFQTINSRDKGLTVDKSTMANSWPSIFRPWMFNWPATSLVSRHKWSISICWWSFRPTLHIPYFTSWQRRKRYFTMVPALYTSYLQ